MAEEFIDLSGFDSPNSDAAQPDRESVKVILIGSRRGISHLIHWFHAAHFTAAGDWSKPQIVPNSDKDEMMSITVKHIACN